MELRVVESTGHHTHVALSGKLDVEGERQIGTEFEQLTAHAGKAAVVDMTEVTYLASLGIRLLFKCAKSLAAQGQKMVVLNPQPMVEETLMTSGTAQFIPIVRSLDEALAILKAE
ncbi:MAG: STAS domain-containing protein [Deltaproteobacteria bacterium]|nr:STAS domain-containing protein [Deltaproteobacteria bacterium]